MKKTAAKPFSRSARGQSLVELGLTMVIILTLLAGAVDFGSAFFDYISLRDAAQEGALYGSIQPIIDANNNGKYDVGESLNTAAIIARVRQSSSQPVDLTSVPVTVLISNPSNGNKPCSGGSITVTVSYTYQISMPFVGAILGTQTIPLGASITDTILTPACP
jgi:Flp pilus assembly protein TadG